MLMTRVAWVMGLMTLTSTLAYGVQVRDQDHEWIAPARAEEKRNPLVGRAEAAAGGRKLFQQRCATCHGGEGRGTAKGPDLMVPDVQSQKDGALFWKISSGNAREGMPSFSFLPEPQRWQLVLHLRAIAAAP